MTPIPARSESPKDHEQAGFNNADQTSYLSVLLSNQSADTHIFTQEIILGVLIGTIAAFGIK